MALRDALRRVLPRSLSERIPSNGESLAQLSRRVARLESEAGRRAVYLGDHQALARLRSGHKIYVDTRDVSIASHLMLDGHWEPWIADVLLPLVKPGMRVCDIGANFGYYTLLMGQAVGPEGHVYAVEANPRLAALLRKSLTVNGLGGRTTLLEVAAWDREDTLSLFVNDSMSGGGSVRRGEAEGRAKVSAVPLDSLIEGPLDVVKIDVEGAEERALAGLSRAIDASGPMAIVTEYYAPTFKDAAGFFGGFARRGFEARIIRAEGLGPTLAPEALVAELEGRLNYVLLRRGEAAA